MKRVTLTLMAAALLAMSGFVVADEEVEVDEDSNVTPAAITSFTPVTILTAATKKPSMPHMELLSPLKRKDVDMSLLARRPCGGTKTGPVHFETTPGSRNIVAWRIHKASPNGRCVVRVGDTPLERDMVLVKPTDGSAGDDGSFPCGREVTSYESKEIRLPRDINCDQCIMQLVWMTDEGDQYRCTDFESTTAEVPECFGQCLNGGICRNGKCMCVEGFSGSNCQYEADAEEKSFLQVLMDDSVVLLVYALMIVAIIAVFVVAYRMFQKREAEKRQANQEPSDKLTANDAGDPNGASKFELFRDTT